MKMSQKKIIGIDLHDYSVEMVELYSGKNKYFLESYSRMIIPEKLVINGDITDENEIKEVIKRLLQTSDPAPALTKNISVLLPSSKVLTHIFRLPGILNESEIKKALPYEAELIIPFSFDDIYWDFSVLKKVTDNNKSSSQFVLFACIQKDVAEKYAKLFESTGLNPVAFGINCESLKNAVSRQVEKDKTYLILDVGTLSVDYLVIRNNVILNYFSSNEGGRKFICGVADLMHESEEDVFNQKEADILSLDSTMGQVAKFMERCCKRGKEIIKDFETDSLNGKVDTVIFTGVFMNLPEFYKMAQDIFPERQIVIANPRVGLEIDDKRFHGWHDSKAENKYKVPYSIYFTNAIGIAIKALKNDGINLLPDRFQENLKKKRNLFLVAMASIFMTAIMVFAAAFLIVDYYGLNFQRRILEIKKSAVQQIIYGTRYQQIYDHILSFNNEINILSRIDVGIFSVERMINSIYDKFPIGIKINSWSYSNTDLAFRIFGVAENRNVLLEMQKNFRQIDFVKDVVAPISNFDEKTNISFSITLKMDFTKLPRHAPTATQS
jgi:type IV pilus assembly protein PilM